MNLREALIYTLSFLSISQVLVLSTCLMDIGYGLCDVSIEWRVNLVRIY